MTLTEAAASLEVTAATLRQQLARGALRGRKVGRDWHVTPREVERYRAESLGRRKPAVRPGVCERIDTDGIACGRGVDSDIHFHMPGIEEHEPNAACHGFVSRY